MRQTLVILRYVLVALAILIVLGLAWWYFFLNAKEGAIKDSDVGRGLGQSAPSFGSAIGSTYENILSSLASLAGNTEERGTSASSRLSQISKTPVAGMGFTGSGTSTALRFVERPTGYVLEVTPSSGTIVRLTNTLVPRVYESKVSADGRVLERFLDERGRVVTILGTIPATPSPTSGTPVPLTQKRLPDDIRSITFSPDGKEIFYIAIGGTGEVVGVRATADGENAKEIFSSPILGWQVHWLRDGRIVLVQNAADGVPGYAYELGKGGSLLPLVPATPGLTVLPHPSSSGLVFGASSGSAVALFAQLDEEASTATLPVRTVADKCVWGPEERSIVFCAVPQRPTPPDFLDLWHRGEAHTADAWWRIDMSAGSTELLYSPGDIILDVENPTIDDRGEYIAFMNAADKSLWLLRVSEK